MTKEPYTTKKGIRQFRPLCNEDEVSDGTLGFCLACGSETSGVEPDARRYKCENCSAEKVYGIEELFVMGLARVAEEA